MMHLFIILLVLSSSGVAAAQFQPGQKSRLMTIGYDGSNPQLVYEADYHLEAPNWTTDGNFLIYNSRGQLYRIPVDGGEPEHIPSGEIESGINNDHGITPDGETIIFSAGHIYTMPIEGGTPHQVTSETPSYWHGVSPDGRWLTYCAQRNGVFDVYVISIDGGEEINFTNSPSYDDGPEYSPDGEWIYFNTDRTGSWDIWKIPADGGEAVPVTDDPYENWFPHFSPDGSKVVILSYPEGTEGHPANRDVKLRLMTPDGEILHDIVSLYGGQGTINVNSWSPDGGRFAYVEYTRP